MASEFEISLYPASRRSDDGLAKVSRLSALPAQKASADILIFILLSGGGRVGMTGEGESDDFAFTLLMTALLLFLIFRLPDYIDAVLEILV